MIEFLLIGALMPGLTSPPELIRQDLRCTLDTAAGAMSVETTVFAPAKWTAGGTITFRLAALMDKPVVKIGGTEVALEAKPDVKEVNYTFAIPATQVGKDAKIDFAYKSHETNGFVFHLGPEGTFAGGYNTTWYPRFESDRSLGHLTFNVPKDIVVKASGKELGAQERGDRKEYSFEVSAPAVLTFAAAPYIVKRIDGKLPVTLYLLHDRPQAESYLQGAAKVVKTLEKEFGKYPFPDFSIIETPSPISSQNGFSGASFEGFIFADSNSLDAPFNLAYFGHEIGHQWWGNLVQREGQKGNYIMSESMAQLGSLRAVEAIEGPAMAARYRFSGYPGYSAVQCGRYAAMMPEGGFDHPLDSLPNDPASHQVANAKGFLAYDALARTMGRDRFRTAVQRITKNYAWRAISFDAFMAELQKDSPVDLKPYVQQWFARTGLPNLDFSWSMKGDELVAAVKQTSPTHKLSLPLQITCVDGSTSWETLNLDSSSAELKLRPRKAVISVALDPMHEVLHTTPELAKEAEALKYVTRAQILSLQGKQKEADEVSLEALKHISDSDPWGVEFRTRMGAASVYRRSGRPTESKEQYLAALRCPIRVAEDIPWAYLRLAQMAKLTQDEGTATWALKQMVIADKLLTATSGAPAEAKRQGL